ncbi:type II toxin-antitoxin system HicA family toxin [candidate division KSB1 bacterium]|nr:type II toxin-antitoxin system HicA family toxin [candidate division KSB1 bacterium]
MAKYEKTLNKILQGTSDTNIDFGELCNLLRRLGFDERIRGSHHIFTQNEIEEILNIQVKQVRNLILKYKLGDS